MLFTNLHFLWFFAVVWAVHWTLRERRPVQHAWLLLASLFFYGYWDWRFLGLIGASTIVDFLCGLGLERADGDPRRRRAILGLSLAANLGTLGFFKYFDFFAASAAEVLTALGLPTSDFTLGLILPVGISFYTFQTLSYTIDVYRRQIPAERDFLAFALYVSFFPQLVAGPIVRAAEFLPSVKARRVFRWSDQREGLELALWGLFKKVVIADNLAPVVDSLFGAPGELGYPARLLAVYAFTVQIYCDFSGYTDIARGTARALGFRFPWNFHRPYFASDPQEFWRRWHVSLSTWLRDYLYIPLGGNRRGPLRTRFNLLATMVLGGLWHGAAWNFVLWGAYQGLLLVGHRELAQRRPARARSLPSRALRWFGFLHLVVFGWLLFRVPDLATLGEFLTPTEASWLIGLELSETMASGLVIGGLGTGMLLAYDWLHQGVQQRPGLAEAETPLVVAPDALRAVVLVSLVLAVSLCGRFVGDEFLYFQF